MVTRHDYGADAVAAAQSVLLELVRVLGAFHDQVVLIGGSVPFLWFSDPGDPHVGSMDVDLGLDHRALTESAYATIRELLDAHGYRPHPAKAHSYVRDVQTPSGVVEVEVDLLAGVYGGRGRKHEHQRVQGVTPRKARGCDLALDHAVEHSLSGRLPDGARDTATVRLAAIVPFLVMKAMALAGRLKAKDAYDIDYCLRHYPGGVEAIAAEFGPLLNHGLVQEALSHLAAKFAEYDSVGPVHVALFREIEDADAQVIEQRSAHARMQRLLALLGKS
jgi:hypothetical protein